MPVYPYKCSKCNFTEDQIFTHTDDRVSNGYACQRCDSGWMKQDYQAKMVQKTPFFEGAVIFKDGKKGKLETKTAVQDYAERNNFVVGGDDLEQEAMKNRKDKEKKETEQTTNAIIEDMKRKKIIGDVEV